MESKKELGKIALAGVLLAASMPMDSQAAESGVSREVYLAVAGCPAGCNLSTGSSQKSSNDPYSDGQVADATNDLHRTPYNRTGGGSFRQNTDDKQGGGTSASTPNQSKSTAKPMPGDKNTSTSSSSTTR